MLNKLTALQIAEAFPDECREYIPRVLPVLEAQFKPFKDKLKLIQDMSVSEPEKDLYRMFVYAQIPDGLFERIQTYCRVKKMLHIKSAREEAFKEINIEAAAAVPIQQLFNFKKLRGGSNVSKACCPFHEDNTPSFMIYRHDNSYHCFSCGAHGDAIDFYKQINGVNFIEAVQELAKLRIVP